MRCEFDMRWIRYVVSASLHADEAKSRGLGLVGLKFEKFGKPAVRQRSDTLRDWAVPLGSEKDGQHGGLWYT
jgi:hypothetical protein